MLAENSSAATPPGWSLPFPLSFDGRATLFPPLQAEKLLTNGFLRELVLALGAQPHATFKGLRIALALDEAYPATLFGAIALRPTFVDMFRSFRGFDVLVPHGIGQELVHPHLTAAIKKLDLQICSSCNVHVLAQEEGCWMCEANGAIAHTMAGFRGVQRLRTPTVLERAVAVPPNGLAVDAVAGSVMRMEIPVGSFMVTTPGGDGTVVRYFRIFATDGETGYLRVVRSGICDFVSHVSAVEIFAEFPAVPPGFLSWIDLPDSVTS